jgi:hypothetical protein
VRRLVIERSIRRPDTYVVSVQELSDGVGWWQDVGWINLPEHELPSLVTNEVLTLLQGYALLAPTTLPALY